MLMRIIAVILGLAAIMIGINAIRYSVTPDSEQQLVTTIRRWRSVPREDSRVLQLVLELQQRRAARNIRTNASFGFCGLLILLAMGAWQYAALGNYTRRVGEPRFFTPLKHHVLAAGRRFSAAFFAREERIVQARSNLRPALERLFGSKKE